MQKHEIEDALADKGDFVKIERLTSFLKEELPIDIKKFVYLKLAELYEKTGMLVDSAKMYDNAALISIAFSEKIKHYVKETELHIKAGHFDMAEESMKKAMGNANVVEKNEIYITIKDFYKRQAEAYERDIRRGHAARIYEKVLEMNISDLERLEIRKKLLVLYEKLGRFKEYKLLKGLDNGNP